VQETSSSTLHAGEVIFASPSTPQGEIAANPRATQVALAVSGGRSHLCYIVEAGCTGGIPDPGSAIYPIFVLAGLMPPRGCVKRLTVDWITLNNAASRDCSVRKPRADSGLDGQPSEGFGGKRARHTGGNERCAVHHRVPDEMLSLIAHHHGRIAGRVIREEHRRPVQWRARCQSWMKHCRAFGGAAGARGITCGFGNAGRQWAAGA
jgi:hypothetical protein